MWMMKHSKTVDEGERPIKIASDSELDSLPRDQAKALFARIEAEGAGDFELSSVPEGTSPLGVVESYSDTEPDWSEALLERVNNGIASGTPATQPVPAEVLAGSAEEQLDRARESLKAVGDQLEKISKSQSKDPK